MLVAASMRLAPIRQAREEMNLVSNASLENAPPSLAFATVAMGAFRGLIVDILWIRADKLKQEGQFFDAKQLAEWITVLQPRFATVWIFHGWNMAYNISVAVPNTQPEERWRWVRNGYELLRDKGIEKNPHSISLYRELAWIFQHKISGVNDDCHMYYKRQLALAMRPLLGEKTREEFQALARAPEELSDIMQDADIKSFVELLMQADDEFANDDRFVKNYMALRQNPNQFADQAQEVVNSFRGTPALEKFDYFARAHQLRKVWKFDIDLMIDLNDKYGAASIDDPNDRKPLNWEHPDVHAMYWAQKGLDVAGKPGKYSVDEKNTDRIIFHSLQNLFRRGKLILYDLPDQAPAVFLRPDLEMFDSLNAAWIERIEKYEAFERGNPKAVRGGHRSMLMNAVEVFYRAGHRVKAAQIYAQLRQRYATPEDRRFDVGLITFVRRRIAEELDRPGGKDATELIVMTLGEAYFRFAVHDDDEAAGRERWAREVYDLYQTGSADGARTGLPPFDIMRYMALRTFMEDPFYPDHLKLRLMGRIKIERPDLFDKLMKQEEAFQKLVEEAARKRQGP
ncbi:MAG: hypothetical protein DRP66_10355 [Planctomycetota bacterium]|nr:MAG: hypothetical protein DRP66_10355 [Planctomycetota bacterium]